MKASAALLLLLALPGCATIGKGPQLLAMAITIDDLPLHGPMPPGISPLEAADQLIAGLKSGGNVPAMAFINGKWTVDEPPTREVLARWRQAGLELGNHGWSHRNLNELSSAEFEAELIRNEPLLRQHSPGSDWRWFRYPFLAEGDEAAKRMAARQVLAKHGYRIAAVTLDFSDWQWTEPYARCLAKDNQTGVVQLETKYLQAAEQAISRSRQLSRAVHGRDIPYVLLLHSGAFTARMMPQLLKLYRERNFRFVSLADASRDPAYAADLHPARPGPPATLEGRAAAAGVPIPRAPDTGAELAAICA